jgi:hypothetical protein
MEIARKIIFTLIVLLSCGTVSDSFAQCAMCRSQVESSIEGEGKVVGRGLNDGILYLMTIPYFILGGFAYMVYRNWKGGQQKSN